MIDEKQIAPSGKENELIMKNLTGLLSETIQCLESSTRCAPSSASAASAASAAVHASVEKTISHAKVIETEGVKLITPFMKEKNVKMVSHIFEIVASPAFLDRLYNDASLAGPRLILLKHLKAVSLRLENSDMLSDLSLAKRCTIPHCPFLTCPTSRWISWFQFVCYASHSTSRS